MEPVPLPVVGAPAPERADAARNRRRILEAAERLFDERGVGNVTMAEVAAAAGVGKATIFRRFGDKATLLDELLGERERELQQALLSGPPPLGPGAPPRERLLAFFHALSAYCERHRHVLLASETARPGARYATGSYVAWQQHVAILLAQLRPDADAPLLADLLLAPFAAELLAHLRDGRGIPVDRLDAALAALAGGVADGGPDAASPPAAGPASG
ncbi:helix-turn-helix domain-containing protein [Conexibacter sp. JD483]|uniref:TetR/AcrR family transcriptional regulator n=1 Tax=unclassified Conexibacter TaxID=2627773 RepID=UPI002728745B|nr:MULTISPECIES: TetR/AcrR family transcriptional regulator [unclassified Conexibacter]MDO8188807.1 helix-turn-helix domain-containing protein [Conexibacter sp. CPCC 205706]MDO8201652.1 helix-turn-helix domain-containing protein [Conexibacter sp. CPCC 205762]MDR9371336.1 helix-turn-helix domain-containing protein [Conexibacter sp. JD483]